MNDALGRRTLAALRKWRIAYDTTRGRIVVEGPDWVDWPLLTLDGVVLWDRPERVPADVRHLAREYVYRQAQGLDV